jgi:hypothetical protein
MDERTFLVAMVERLTNLLDLIEDKKKHDPIAAAGRDDDLCRLELAAMDYMIALLKLESRDAVKE